MEKNKQKRSTYRSLTTKLITKIDNAVLDDNTPLEELEELLEELLLKDTQLRELDNEIQVEIKDNTEMESDIVKADEYTSTIVRAKCKLKRNMGKFKPSMVQTPLLPAQVPEIQPRRVESSIRLPLLSIELYNGDPCDFQRFYDQFESAIHKNPDLSNIEKFNYLKSYLTSAAANAIKGFSLTNENYNAALETIRNRFGKKPLVINSHLNKLLSLTPIKKSNDLIGLRNFLDTCKTEIRNLESLDLKIENYSALLAPILIKLLPNDLVLEITRQFGSEDNLSVSNILDYLGKEIISREQTAAFISFNQCEISHSTVNKKSFNSSKPYQNTLETAAVLLNENKHFSGPRSKCIVCCDFHSLSQCDVFKNKQLDEKYKILRKHGICYVCFCFGHVAHSCRKVINCEKCYSSKHNTILCSQANKSTNIKSSNTLSNKSECVEVLMQTLKVKLINENKTKIIRALMDTGSQKSYASNRVINFMGYRSVGEQVMTHNLFGGIQKTKKHKKYRIMIESNCKDYRCDFIIYDQDKICNDVPSIRYGPWIKNAKKYGIFFSDYDSNTGLPQTTDEIDLLIGADIYGKLLTGKIKSLTRGVTAIETQLGWILSGKTFDLDKIDSTETVLNLHVAESQLSDLWKLDTLGILDPSEKESKTEIEGATVDYFRKTIHLNSENRYEVSLPWIKGHAPLSNGRKIAERRLKTCIDSLGKSGNIEAYESVFEEWVHEGVIEIVGSPEEPEDEFFLPHRPVIKENSTTRVRPVFDGSAREKGTPSINECLATGPNLVELIPSIINRFRLRKIGVTADIRKAFLQISLNEKDRPFLRFLWGKGGNPNDKITFQHRRVVFGLTTSPFLLGATLQYHFENAPESLKDTASKLSDSFYIDNCLISVDDEAQLTKFISESVYLLSLAKFDLRGWEHNLFAQPPEEQKITLESKTVPVLGLKWQLQTDTLTVDLRDSPKNDKPITKRNILSEIHKIFDPIGYTCPVTLLPKIMLQQLWKLKVSWDSELPENIVKKFKRWKDQLNVLESISIPRCLSDELVDNGNLSLHVFCDASQVAYATCIFLRHEGNSSTTCRLVQARSRVAPLKSTTIPRLELLGCTIGTRLARKVKEDLKMEGLKTFYWTDSSNALCWIKGSENWAPFVYNRVQEIRTYSDPKDWFLVPGSHNPADLPSRGSSAETLKKSQWWEGPLWLRDPPEFWPKSQINPDYAIINSEKRKTIKTLIGVSEPHLEFFEKTSSYLKMIKVIAWVYRFYTNVTREKGERNLKNLLNAEEMNFAENILLRYAQKYLSLGSQPCSVDLPVFHDDMGIIRVKTRIAARDDLYAFRYPILLDNNHITFSLIVYYHLENQHAGIQTLMSLLREKFWILKCRKTVRNIINKCVTCKRFVVNPTETISAPLPEDRVREAAVYEITGLDICGPLFLKNGSKLWIILFTCAVFRAIHLELITSLSTECFILALRRFIARRGRPSIIISDNGTNFVKASSELKTLNWSKIEQFASVKRITWKHNPPAAPWWGGFFERMIGMLKRILRKVLGKASLNYEELFTIICDAESIINTRPLTYISENDEFVPLTPAMFIQDIKESGVPDLDIIESQRLRKRLLYKQKLQADLRKRFRIEYLGNLKGFNKVNKENTLREGDIVLIGDDNTKRIYWPLGKVLKLLPGKDGKSRVAAVLFREKTLIRPLKRLYNLEITNNDFSSRLGERLPSLKPGKDPDSSATPDEPIRNLSPSSPEIPAPDPPVHRESCADQEMSVPSPISPEVSDTDPRLPGISLYSTDPPVPTAVVPKLPTSKASPVRPPQSRFGRNLKAPDRYLF